MAVPERGEQIRALGGFEGLVEAGPVDAAGLENEVGFLEKVLETALTSAITTV